MIKIGFFDSGIGGLSILREVDNLLPQAQYYYLADPEFMPYGNKTPAEIMKRSSLLVEELIEAGCFHIVVACNTATAVAIDFLRQKHHKVEFIGIEPYVNVINKMPKLENPVLLLTESMSKTQRFLKLKDTKDPFSKIDIFPCKRLASIAERAFYEGPNEKVLEEIWAELSPLQNKGHTHAILGCTHYNFVKKIIGDFLQLDCICPGDHVAKRVQSLVNRPWQKTIPPDGFHFKNLKENNWHYRSRKDLNKVLAYV